MPIVLLLSLLVFRGVVAALLPPLVGTVAIGTTLLGLRAVVEVTDVSVFALNLVTGLGFGLAIDYSLLMVSRYREEIDRSGPGVTRSRDACDGGQDDRLQRPDRGRRDGLAGRVSAAGFCPRWRRWCAGRASAAAVALVSLAALLALLGTRVNGLSPPRWQHPPSGGRWGRIAHAVMRRPRTVAVTSGVLLVALALPVSGLRVAGIDARALPPSASARQVADALQERGLRGIASPLNLVLRRPPSAADVRRIRDLPGVAQVTPPVAAGQGVWRVDIASFEPVPRGRRSALVKDLRAAFPGGLLTGQGAAIVDQRTSIVTHVPWALGCSR